MLIHFLYAPTLNRVIIYNMATGKVHGRVTVALSIPTALSGYAWDNDPMTALLVGVGCLLGLFIEPDLDVNHITQSEIRLIRTLGPIGLLWVVIWHPYAKLIAHRSPLSHAPLTGTVLRYVYLFLWLVVISIPIGVIVGDTEWMMRFLVNNRDHILLLMLGNAISDIGHWILDWR